MQYSNPRMNVVIEDWPYGRDMTTTATFRIEVHPTRGERAARTTIDPTTGRISAPHRLTYAHSACFVDGDDGKLYILEDTGTHYSIMKSTMAHQHETVFPGDGERYAALTFLFNQLDQHLTTEEQAPMPGEPTPETVKIVSKKVRVRKMAEAVPANDGESKIAMREAGTEAQATEAAYDAAYGHGMDGRVMHQGRSVPRAALATEAELDAIFGQETPTTVVAPETQVSVEELPEPTKTIREMTVDTANRDAYRAQLLSASADDDGMRMVATWTTAPKEYDASGTVVVEEDAGLYAGHVVRHVETPLRHLAWQRGNYVSGHYAALAASAWKARGAHNAIAPRVHDLLAIVDTQPLAQALETLKGQETDKTTLQPVSTIRSAHAQYLIDLVAQGDAAIEAALARRTVTVKLPGTDATRPRTPREPRTCDDAPKAPLTPKQIATLLEREQLGHFASNTSSTRELLRRKGVLTSNQINAELTAHGHALVATLRATMQTPAALAS